MLQSKRQPARIKEIIKLVKQQEPERKDIIKSLKKCSGGKWTSSGYYLFVFTSKSNKGTEWKFNENIVLEHEFLGFIVLDVLKNGSIAGIEYINLVNEQELIF
ncbi:MAG TPA: hypothetical protein VFU62_08255 [Hanamia sp.]|jgi:hypothetical protein|nr:hypothetical protein [Hanamia sp.]